MICNNKSLKLIIALFLLIAMFSFYIPFYTAADVKNYYVYSDTDKKPAPVTGAVINGDAFKRAETLESSINSIQGQKGGIINSENEWLEWDFEIKTEGLYALYFDYIAFEDQVANLIFAVAIDEIFPFTEAANLSLPLLWEDEKGGIKHDNLGNDIRPKQIQVSRAFTLPLYDVLGHYDHPYLFNLTQGVHTLRVQRKKGDFLISQMRFENLPAPPNYEDYSGLFSDKEDNAKYFKQEAEKTLFKTASTLYPTSNNNDAATTPSSSSKIRMNTIGGNNWRASGEILEWEIDVPADGWYNISFRARQNINQGMTSYRRLYIDGFIPFEDAEIIEFPFHLDWYMKTLGGTKTPVYLSAGKHTISMEPTCGKMSSVLRALNKVIGDLNKIYRKIIIVTGTMPDIYRDYQLEKEIPDLYHLIAESLSELEDISASIKNVTGEKGSIASIIDEDIAFFKEILKRPYTIPERISTFSGNVEGLGSLYLSLANQPLELDSISFVPIKEKIPSAKAGFFSALRFAAEKFIYSFFNDYNDMGDVDFGKKEASVWASTGRDQAQVLLGLIPEGFSSKSGISIKLQLVDTGNTLLMATLAGSGPDAALMLPKEFPVNLAMREALVDLKSLGAEALSANYYESALIPYRYKNGIYALPESQMFDMLFYRTDILEELSLTPPQTWDEFYTVLKRLHANNLSVGIPEMDRNNLAVSGAISTFDKFLFQSGGTYYNSNLDQTRFDTPLAHTAFEKVIRLYTDYNLDREFDFFNRFRSGEMAMAIQNYSVYNLLAQAAPEIRGLWSFAPIPGIKMADGSINRSESSSGTCCIMMNSAKKKGIETELFDFLSWWVSGETQGKFGTEIESIMGATARYNPANHEAFEKIPWSDTEKMLIKEQWKWVKDVNQIPGNYYISRSLTSAIRLSIDDGSDPKRNLAIYNKIINSEIERKRREFGSVKLT